MHAHDPFSADDKSLASSLHTLATRAMQAFAQAWPPPPRTVPSIGLNQPDDGVPRPRAQYRPEQPGSDDRAIPPGPG